MKKSDKIKIDRLIHKIGLENSMSDNDIREIVESQFEFTEKKLKELNQQINNKENINAEDYAKVFYFKSLCRLYICKHRLSALLKRRELINKINND